MKKVFLVMAVLALLSLGGIAQAVTIDGTITAGEWVGATTYNIGNGAGTVSLKADTSFVYGAFDITGWTAAMGAGSGGNLLGFGVWGANNSYPTPPGVEFAQSSPGAGTLPGYSGTMNGLDSAFSLNAVVQASIPGDLQAMDSFATGHRVWEVMMPISTMGVSAGDTIWAIGGINYDKAQHWYPNTFMDPVPYRGGYAPILVTAGSPAVPEPMSIMLGIMGLGSVAGFKRFRRA